MLVKDKFHVTCLSLDWGCLLFWCFINISHKFLNRAWEAGVKSVAYPWDESHIRCVRNQCNAWCIGLDYGKKIREFWAENSLQNTNLQIIIFQLSISCLKVKTPIFYCILKRVISDPNARCWVPDASIGEDGREEASKAVCELNSLTSASEWSSQGYPSLLPPKWLIASNSRN